MKQSLTAKPEENIAFIEFSIDGYISGYVTLGSITCRPNYYYEQVEASSLPEAEFRKYPISEFKYNNGRIYRPKKFIIIRAYRNLIDSITTLIKRTCNSYSIKILASVILVSTIASIASSFISAYTLKSLGILSTTNTEDILAVFIPTLAIFITLIGIWITLSEHKKLQDRQRQKLIKPELAFSTSDDKDQDIRKTILPEAKNCRFTTKSFSVTNIGNGLAKNIMFFQYDENNFPVRSHVYIKRLLSNEADRINIALSNDDNSTAIRVFSRFEDIDGNKIIQLHLFTQFQTNDASHHLNDLVLDPALEKNRLIYKQLT